MEHDWTVVIAGGGVGGLTAALALHRNGVPVQVYERRTAAEIRTAAGSGLTLWSNAATALGWLGLGEQLLAVAEPIHVIESFDTAGRVRFRMNAGRHLAPGALPSLSIGRMDLAELLIATCAERGVPVHYGEQVTGYQDTVAGVNVQLADRSVPAAALIGADGVRSRVLTQLHGSVPGIYLGRTTYRGVVEGGADLPAGRAQLFHDDATRIGGGVYPIGGGRSAWTLSEHAPAGQQDPPGQCRDRAVRLARPLPAILRDRVARTPDEAIIRTDIWYHEWHQRWGEGAVTLLGDAAHAMPNDLGQGACQAIEDAVVLADALAGAFVPETAGSDRVGAGAAGTSNRVPAALRDYERRRWDRVRWVREQSVRVATAPEPSNAVARWLMHRLTRLYLTAAEGAMWRPMLRPPELTSEHSPIAAAAAAAVVAAAGGQVSR